MCAVARLGLILLLSQKIKKKLWPRRSCFSREHFTINNIDFAFFFFFCCTYTRNYSGKRTFSEPRLYIVNLATLVIFGSGLYKCFNVFILENCFFFFFWFKNDVLSVWLYGKNTIKSPFQVHILFRPTLSISFTTLYFQQLPRILLLY